MGRTPPGGDDDARVATINAFIAKCLPEMTVVAGLPVYRHE